MGVITKHVLFIHRPSMPAPDRPSSWKTFLKAHWGEVAATDFFSTEVWTRKGLVTYYTLFVIDLKTRRVHVAGSTPHPGETFMTQVARNLTDAFDGFLGDRILVDALLVAVPYV
jgi:hypothetical protein